MDEPARQTLARIRAASLTGHVEFLASDTLEGRGTPSRGLDIAAEYIAAQFRRAGLEPAGDSTFFQTAPYLMFDTAGVVSTFTATRGEKTLATEPAKLRLEVARALALNDAAIEKVTDPELLERNAAQFRSKVVAVFLKSRFDRDGIRLYQAARRARPALLIVCGAAANNVGRRQLVAADLAEAESPVIGVLSGELSDAIEAAPAGDSGIRLSVGLKEPASVKHTLRNVVAVLRGADPALAKTYVLVTAHYDHLGMRGDGTGDRIFNGANDDASGAASLMEIAAALAASPVRPKRSILFVAFFGEELGLLGSQYYGRHPLVPLAATVADINLEHLGRTDSSEGPRVASASITGFDYSSVPAVFAEAGRLTGVEIYKDDKRSDAFFARSDNQALADVGVPAHTLCVAFEFPDYHRTSDEAGKLDYENMAKVDRTIALSLVMLADSADAPEWRETEKTHKYTEAHKRLLGVAPVGASSNVH